MAQVAVEWEYAYTILEKIKFQDVLSYYSFDMHDLI